LNEGQTERIFGDEGVAFDDFIRNRNTVVFSFIVSGDPDFAFIHADLRTANDMTRRMQRKSHAVDREGFVPIFTRNDDVSTDV
jgi:hypothetical protein